MNPIQGDATTIAVLAACVLFAAKTVYELVKGRWAVRPEQGHYDMALINLIQQQSAVMAQISATQTIITASLREVSTSQERIISNLERLTLANAEAHATILGRTQEIQRH